MSALPDLLERIYATGRVEDADGNLLPAVPIGLSRDAALGLAALVRDEELQRTLEVGLAYGLSALAITGVHAQRGRGSHTAVDPYAATHYRSIGRLNLERAGLAKRAEIVEEGSETALPRLAAEHPEGFDFVLVDGRHHFDTTLVDLFHADRLLAAGGFLAVDDVELDPVARALAYVLSNRAFEAVKLPDSGVAVLRKLHSDNREWDHHVSFESAKLRDWLPAPELPDPQPMPLAPLAASPRTSEPASLSFCITTQGPAARVRGLLELIRPHADEIVLAVNRDRDLDTLDACADLADRRLTYEFRESPSRLVGWIMHQCSADWILRLDDDEVPSAALLRALPDLLRDRRPCEVLIKRRWLYRTPDQMISMPSPWNAEYQARLVRNLPGAWRFDGRVHTDVRVAGERRLLEAPMYHGALVLSPLEARRRRAMAYEMLRPGVAYGGLPVNGMYLPEAVEGVETVPVPDEDRAAIAAVLRGSDARPAPGTEGAPVQTASFADVDAVNGTRKVGPAAYAAAVRFVAPPDRCFVSSLRHLELRITNLGDETWTAGESDPRIRLGYRWRDDETGRVVYDGRTLFEESVAPGATVIALLAAEAPDEPGDYRLEVDVVHEHVRWFDCEAVTPVRVEPRPEHVLVTSPRLAGAFNGEAEESRRRVADELVASREAVREAEVRLYDLRNGPALRRIGRLVQPFDALRRRRGDGD